MTERREAFICTLALETSCEGFNLHQNLLEAIRNTINSVFPVDIRIPSDSNSRTIS